MNRKMKVTFEREREREAEAERGVLVREGGGGFNRSLRHEGCEMR